MSATVTALAWTLIHFLWQGGLIAAVLALALRAARNSRANVRYLLACTAMAAMFGSAVGTFLWISRPAEVRGAPAALAASSNPAPEPAAATPATPQKDASTPFSNYLSWLVYLWATGVLALSIRTGAGFVVAQRLKHRLASPLDPAWQQRFARLAQRLEIARTVRACESALAEVPSVVGWIRPVVLVPASALLNLPPCEIEALLAHELAHIRRHDYLVNLLQKAIETLLFYHPAVWWTGQKIRAERENCCDDLAVAVCGDVLTYARALTRLEQLRPNAPAMAMAANSGSLRARIHRLVRPQDAVRKPSGDWMTGVAILLSATAICAAGRVNLARILPLEIQPAPAVVRAQPVAFLPAPKPEPLGRRVDEMVADQSQPEELTQQLEAAQAELQRVQSTSNSALLADQQVQAAQLAQIVQRIAALSAQAAQEARPETPSGGFIDGLAAEGYKNLTVDELIAFKIHGVTPEYIRRIQAAGFHPTPDELVAMRIHGVDADQMAAFKAAGLDKLTIDELVALRIHGATPEFINGMKAAGFARMNADEVVTMKIHGVTPEFAREIKSLGIGNPSIDDLVAMKIHGLTPEFAREVKAMNLRGSVDLDKLVEMKIHGVTSGFIRELQKRGFKDLSVDQVVRLKELNILGDSEVF